MASDDSPAPTAAPDSASRDMLRALAHPLRLEIMETVRRLGTARASDVAEVLDMPVNSVSYHLRTLARGGVVVEAPEAARDKRDRVWKLAHATFIADDRPPEASTTSDAEPSEAIAMSLAVLDWMRSSWAQGTSRSARGVDGDASRPNTMVASSLRVTEQQARELADAVNALLQEYTAKNRDENQADVPGDPDSEGPAHDYRALFVLSAE